MSFEDAQMTCENFGGHLPIISDARENDYVFAYTQLARQSVWIGIRENVRMIVKMILVMCTSYS